VDFGKSLKNQGLLKPPSSAARTPPKADFLKALSDTYLSERISGKILISQKGTK
jgi:hypothetical protein